MFDFLRPCFVDSSVLHFNNESNVFWVNTKIETKSLENQIQSKFCKSTVLEHVGKKNKV